MARSSMLTVAGWPGEEYRDERAVVCPVYRQCYQGSTANGLGDLVEITRPLKHIADLLPV